MMSKQQNWELFCLGYQKKSRYMTIIILWDLPELNPVTNASKLNLTLKFNLGLRKWLRNQNQLVRHSFFFPDFTEFCSSTDISQNLTLPLTTLFFAIHCYIKNFKIIYYGKNILKYILKSHYNCLNH